MTKIILIRGNSGSGKTAVAKRIQSILGQGTLLISQDVARREMLKVKDRPGNLAIGLIETMIDYGKNHCDYMIIEGILAENKYGEMLRKTLSDPENVFPYLLRSNIGRDYTQAQHQSRCRFRARQNEIMVR